MILLSFDSDCFPGLPRHELRKVEKNRLHRRWLEQYLRLKLFLELFGRMPYQKEQYPKGMSIGSWASAQKLVYKSGKMPLWRFKLLSGLGFDWGKKREDWLKKFSNAKHLQDLKGSPLSRYGSNEDERLAKQWLYEQQEQIARGLLSAKRKRMLNDAGLIVDRIEYRWNTLFNDIKKFVEKKQRLPSAYSLDAKEKALGKWRLYQVSRMREGKLSGEKTKNLRALGLTDKIVDIEWDRKFTETCQLIKNCLKTGEIYGNNGIRESLGDELYTWWRDQRRKYRQNELSKEHRKLIKDNLMHYRVSELLKMNRFPQKRDKGPKTAGKIPRKQDS